MPYEWHNGKAIAGTGRPDDPKRSKKDPVENPMSNRPRKYGCQIKSIINQKSIKMKTRNLLLVLVTVCLVALGARADHLHDHILVAARMDGGQEVPAVSTDALGVGSLTISPGMDSICVNIAVTGLSGPLTGIHIHEAMAGENGGVVIDLTPYIVNNRIATTLTGPQLTSELMAKLLSGHLYLNAHTDANPNGEIRGQLYLETDKSYPVSLSGLEEVPQVATSAYGVGVFNLSKDQSNIKFNVVVQGLSGAITGAHLHYGMAGVNGPVVANLTGDVNGNVISGIIIDPTAQLMDSLAMGHVYLNVHTDDNPGGEIRSQLHYDSKYLYFDAAMDAAQEVTPSLSTGLGAATFRLNTTMDTLWYDAAVDGLTGEIQAAHLHTGAVGVSGGVVVDLTASIDENRITGMITGSAITSELIGSMLSGGIYLNVHTFLYPDGEIRGQVYRLMREGYTFGLEGAQEVPPVTTSAQGSGMVSIDRDQSNAHYMFVVSGLTPTAAHFHNEAMGANGAVIYNLSSSLMNNGAFGYWKANDLATPFMTANSVMFRSNTVYVNVHTAANPDGELRGQVWRDFNCYNIGVGIAEAPIGSVSGIALFPNPVIETMQLNLNAERAQQLSMTIVDVRGKVLMAQNLNTYEGMNRFSIDTDVLPAGIYMLRLQNERGQNAIRFVKQ